VLLAFYTGNDVVDNSKEMRDKDYHPCYVYQGEALVLDDRAARERRLAEESKKTWWSRFYRWRHDTFRFEQMFRRGQKAFGTCWPGLNHSDQEDAAGKGSEGGIYDEIYREPTAEVWKDAWRVTEGVLLLLRDEVGRAGARSFVVVLTNPIQVHPAPAVRSEFAEKLGFTDLFYPDRRLERLCRREGIPVLLLAPDFQQYVTQHQVYLHGFKDALGFGHWNQNGHPLAGQQLAEWLGRQLD
jgi:hypothetical protein